MLNEGDANRRVSVLETELLRIRSKLDQVSYLLGRREEECEWFRQSALSGTLVSSFYWSAERFLDGVLACSLMKVEALVNGRRHTIRQSVLMPREFEENWDAEIRHLVLLLERRMWESVSVEHFGRHVGIDVRVAM